MMPKETGENRQLRERISPRKKSILRTAMLCVSLLLSAACSTEAARPYFRQDPGPTVTPLDPRSPQIPDAVLQACFNAVNQMRESNQPEGWDGETKCIRAATKASQ